MLEPPYDAVLEDTLEPLLGAAEACDVARMASQQGFRSGCSEILPANSCSKNHALRVVKQHQRFTAPATPHNITGSSRTRHRVTIGNPASIDGDGAQNHARRVAGRSWASLHANTGRTKGIACTLSEERRDGRGVCLYRKYGSEEVDGGYEFRVVGSCGHPTAYFRPLYHPAPRWQDRAPQEGRPPASGGG